MAVDQIIWMALTTWSLWALNLCAESCHVSSQPLCWILPLSFTLKKTDRQQDDFTSVCTDSSFMSKCSTKSVSLQKTARQQDDFTSVCTDSSFMSRCSTKSFILQKTDSNMALPRAQTPVLCPDVPKRTEDRQQDDFTSFCSDSSLHQKIPKRDFTQICCKW